jgi:hypothetical protein
MPNKTITRDFYLNKLDFREFGGAAFDGYHPSLCKFSY